MKRLFLGLHLTGEALTSAEGLLSRLRREASHQAVRWVRPEKLHVTLAFLGGVDEERIAEIAQVCRPVAAGVAPLTLRLTELGGFPDLRRPRVVWLGIEDLPALSELQSGLASALMPLIKLEDRPYHPHVTLGRVSPGSPAVGRMVQAVADDSGRLSAEWIVSEVELIESVPDGRYVTIERYPFGT